MCESFPYSPTSLYLRILTIAILIYACLVVFHCPNLYFSDGFSHDNLPLFIFLCEVSVLHLVDFLIRPYNYFCVVRALYISCIETHSWVCKKFPSVCTLLFFSLAMPFKKQTFLMLRKFILSIFVHFIFSVV